MECLRHHHTADELFLRSILWTDEACLTREGVFTVHKSRLWARDKPHAIHEDGYHVRFSVIWTRIIGHIFVGHCLLIDIVIFGNCFAGDVSRCASWCEVEFVVSARRSCSALWARFPVAAPRSPLGTPQVANLYSPVQSYQRSRGKT
jgi:hypothetical protein